MPPRPLALAILVFWLAMSGAFVVRELLPRLRPEEPTLFAVELIDEAGRERADVGWTVSRNGVEAYKAGTDWQYLPEADAFKATCKLDQSGKQPDPGHGAGRAWPPDFRNLQTENVYRIGRGEQPEDVKTTTTLDLFAPGEARPRRRVEVILTGSPANGRLAPRAAFTLLPLDGGRPERPHREVDGDAVALSPQGTFLNPLHPPRRLREVREGQEWRVPVLDPLAAAALPDVLDEGWAAPAGGRAFAHVLTARVLPGTRTLKWWEEREAVCRVIACRGDGDVIPALTLWVGESDGLVYRHEATLWGDEWVFARRLIPVLAGPRPSPPTRPDGPRLQFPRPKTERVP